MQVLRTPDERFANLPGFACAPRYVAVRGLRVHYVVEGPRDGEAVLLLHGEPTWSYLYRKMIPILAGAGLRAIALDFIGFGRSDKLALRGDYSYQFHVDVLKELLTALDLRGLTLVGQDWGGLIGLRVLAEVPERFERVVVANTFLPTGDRPASEAFSRWREYSQNVPGLHCGGVVKGGTVLPLPPEVIAAYDAPFPDESYKAAARAFPLLVPVTPDDPAAPANRAAWEVLKRWTKPFLTAFSDGDPVTAGGDRILQKLVPGAHGQPHTTIRDAGHFLQEDKGEELAEVIVDFIRRAARPR